MPKSDICVRRAVPTDDVEAIAKYLYLTDEWIYPTLAPACSDAGWVEFIRANLKNESHIFSARRLLVALRGGRVIGVCCSFSGGEHPVFAEHVPRGAEADYRFVERHYFCPLFEEGAPQGAVCVSNLCVAPSERGNGVGKTLLGALIGQEPHREIWLDVVADNAPAVGLYKSLGFLPQKQYKGFGGKAHADVLCLRMMRPKQK